MADFALVHKGFEFVTGHPKLAQGIFEYNVTVGHHSPPNCGILEQPVSGAAVIKF